MLKYNRKYRLVLLIVNCLTWNPPCNTLQCEQALKQAVPGTLKLIKVTLDTVRPGLLGVLIPPVPGKPVLRDVWEIIKESCREKREREREKEGDLAKSKHEMYYK